MKKIHYSWVICGAATLALFATVGLLSNAFSVFLPYVIKQNNFTYTQGSSIIMARHIATVLSMLSIGWVYNKLSLRQGMTMAISLAAVTFFLYATATSFLAYCAASLLSGVAYTLGGMIPASVLLMQWFKGHRALAMGLCSAGSGVAAIIAPPALTKIIENFSLTTGFFFTVGIESFCAVALFLLVRDTPEQLGLEPYGAALPENASPRKLREAKEVFLTKRQRNWILAAMFLIGAGINNAFGHLAVLYKTEGYDSMVVAMGLSFVGLALTVGKCLCGQIMDWIGTYKTNYIFCGITVIGFFFYGLASTHLYILFYSGMLLAGVGISIITVGMSLWAADLSSAATYSTTIKDFQTCSMVGTLLFSLVPGIFADVTGSYTIAYWVMGLLVGVSLLIIQRTYREVGKDR